MRAINIGGDTADAILSATARRVIARQIATAIAASVADDEVITVPGKDGINGTNGADGVTPSLAIGSVNVLPPTAEATAAIEGSSPNLVLHLGIPAGAPGVKGDTGSAGDMGNPGIPGTDGRDGVDGKAGTDGLPGAKGDAGDRGNDGVSPTLTLGNVTAGDTATATLRGGPAYILDLTIPRGLKGLDGAAGTPGISPPPPTFTIGTVVSGTSASATIRGAYPSYFLDLVIPKGADGMNGSAGKDGASMHMEYPTPVAVPAMPTVLTSAYVDVPVTWSAPFADATYKITKPALTLPATLLGKVDAVVLSQTKTGCVIRVTTTAVLAAVSATVTAFAFG